MKNTQSLDSTRSLQATGTAMVEHSFVKALHGDPENVSKDIP